MKYKIIEDEIKYKENLKKEFFENQKVQNISDFSKYKYQNKFKNSKNILNNLKNTQEFFKIKNYMSIKDILSSFLSKHIMDMIFFGYYRNSKLTIKVMHPVGQTELNYKKQDLISIFRKLENFSDIKEVSIFREDKLNKFSKNFNQDFYDIYYPNSKNRTNTKDLIKNMNFFPERSIGIFENKSKNINIKKKFEDIRKIIKQFI